MSKRNIRDRLCAALDIAPDILPGGSLVEIRDRGYVRISGCGRILDYTRESIRVTVRGGVLSINGRGLLCSSFCRGELGVEGRISGVCFEEEI